MDENQNLSFYPEELNFDKETGKFSRVEKKEETFAPTTNFNNTIFQNLLKDNSLLKNFAGKNISKEELLMQALSSSFKKDKNIEQKTQKINKKTDFFEDF